MTLPPISISDITSLMSMFKEFRNKYRYRIYKKVFKFNPKGNDPIVITVGPPPRIYSDTFRLGDINALLEIYYTVSKLYPRRPINVLFGSSNNISGHLLSQYENIIHIGGPETNNFTRMFIRWINSDFGIDIEYVCDEIECNKMKMKIHDSSIEYIRDNKQFTDYGTIVSLYRDRTNKYGRIIWIGGIEFWGVLGGAFILSVRDRYINRYYGLLRELAKYEEFILIFRIKYSDGDRGYHITRIEKEFLREIPLT